MHYLTDNPKRNYYTEEQLGDTKYYTAIYPDPAVASTSVEYHDDHKDTPESDFNIGDVMGCVVIRIPIS